jgi:hypothetical protein
MIKYQYIKDISQLAYAPALCSGDDLLLQKLAILITTQKRTLS